jgi:RHS repeat-associated protein
LITVHVCGDFTGKERDTETGLDFFLARYYSGAQGRFTSLDWSAKPQPVPYADFADPQTLNIYLYVRNNPLGSADADGHSSSQWNWSEFFSGVADTTYRPVVQAISHPIDTATALGNAATHPFSTAVAIKSAVVATAKGVASGDPKAIGQVVGTVLSTAATVGTAKAITSLVQGARVAEGATASG